MGLWVAIKKVGSWGILEVQKMRLIDLFENIRILKSSADMDTEVSGIRYDSRQVSAGDIFVAIVGYETDGNKYISEAISRGAVAVVCGREPDETVPYILVEDCRMALAAMSVKFFGDPASSMKVIGVTGTNGKTTSAFLLKQIIEKCSGAKVGLIGTNGNMIGDVEIESERTTPESSDLQGLLRDMADSGCEHVVMEVSSHSLALSRVHGIEFVVGAFTNLSQDHLDFHSSMDEYARCKALLFNQCRNAAINIDDEYAEIMLENVQCPVVTFAINDNAADIVAKDVRLRSEKVVFHALEDGEIERVELKIPGKFSIYNALGVIACARALGFGLVDVSAALREAKGVKGRVEVVPTGTDYTVIIDYAHTPDALENVLKAVKGFAIGRVIALFGCGGDRDAKKRPIMGKIAARLADFVIVTSDNPRTEPPKAIIDDILVGMKDGVAPYVVIEDRREAIAYALDNALKDDIIILAGKGHETYQILGKVKHHMDEREIVREHLGY